MGSGHAANDQSRARGMETARRALDLRRGGATYRQIADSMNLSLAGAEKAVKRGLKMIVAEPAKDVLQIELDRLDGMWLGLWPRIQKGEPAAVSAGVRVIERRAKLLGLDKPTQINIRHVIDEVATEYGLEQSEAEQLFADVTQHLAKAKVDG